MAAAYYLLLSGHDVTVFERDPAPGGMLRYGIPQYRLPKVEVLEAEYESVTARRQDGREPGLGRDFTAAKIVCNQGLGRDFTLDDLQYQGFDAVVIAIGCYDTNKLGIPGEDAPEVLDGLEYLRTATLGLPYPNHKGKRVVVIGGGFTSMDCSRTSIRQGAKEVTLVYRRDMKDMPASNEVHEAIEEGVTAIFQAGPIRVITDKDNNVTGVEFIRMALGAPDASGRRRPEPAAGHRVHDPLRPRAAGDRPGAASSTGSGPARRVPRPPRTSALQADAVTFETGRPGVFGTGDVRIGAATVVQAIAEGRRAAYAVDAFLRGNDLAEIRTRQTLAEPQPEFLSIVPFTAEVKEPRYRLKAIEAEERNHSYVEYEIPYSREEIVAESTRCLQCTCEAIGYCDLRRLGIEYGTTLTTLEPDPHQGAGLRSVNENRFTGINHDYVRDDSHAFILREPSRCIDCGRCAQVCAEVVGRGVLRLHAHRLRHARDDAARHEPQRHAVRVLRPLRRDLPDRRADAQAARPPEVRGRREPLHPVRHLRRRLPVRRAARRRRVRARPLEPRGADDRPHGDGPGRPRDRGHVHPQGARLAAAGDRGGPVHRVRPAADGPARDAVPRRRLRQRPRHGTRARHGAAPGRTAARTPT